MIMLLQQVYQFTTIIAGNNTTLNNKEKDNVVVFGTKSNYTEFIFKYPWMAMLILFLTLEGVTFSIDRDIELLLKPIVIVLPLFVAITALAQYLTSHHCYKVAIDKNRHVIKFYLMFNRGIVEKKIQDVKIVIDNNCKIIINGHFFVVFVEILHRLVSYLPEDTEISFVGFWGRFKENDWRRRNLKLEPGENSRNSRVAGSVKYF